MNNLTTIEPGNTRPRPDWEAVMFVEGDSMAPTFTSGDLLEVDRRVNDVRGDAIYVFTIDNQIYVKALQMVPDGSFQAAWLRSIPTGTALIPGPGGSGAVARTGRPEPPA